ncbi:hypothetical protein [Actinoplanes rectilineatus]|uniref:hypothetical protein n=1 Tax=Actinoplanes rectilineatus TaxID=113571 RepID=UPI0005F27D84|nr:hypothetical protein [Actinoplanes rectilineatus]
MPKAPAVIGNLFAAAMGRTARVLRTTTPAPGFVELTLDAPPPAGGWRPGHEVQFRVSPTLSRRYTVHTADGPHIEILAAVSSGGPGAAFVKALRPGDEVSALAAVHIPLRAPGTRRLHLGDDSALGTFAALVPATTGTGVAPRSPAALDTATLPTGTLDNGTLHSGAHDVGALRVGGMEARARAESGHVVVVEVPAAAVEPLAARWPAFRFLPANGAPGDTVQSWLESAALDDTSAARENASAALDETSATRENASAALADVDGALLLGHAQSIQRQRRALINRGLSRRVIATKPYWSTGREGL